MVKAGTSRASSKRTSKGLKQTKARADALAAILGGFDSSCVSLVVSACFRVISQTILLLEPLSILPYYPATFLDPSLGVSK